MKKYINIQGVLGDTAHTHVTNRIELGQDGLTIKNSFIAFPTNLQRNFSDSFKYYYCCQNQTSCFIFLKVKVFFLFKIN